MRKTRRLFRCAATAFRTSRERGPECATDGSNQKAGSDQKAGDGIRTHDNNVGNVVLYQLSYTRVPFWSEEL